MYICKNLINMKIKKIVTTQQTMTVCYGDEKMQKFRFDNVELQNAIRKNGLVLSVEDSTNNRKVYIPKVEAETSNDIEDDAAQTTIENENVITERNASENTITITDFKGLGLRIAKTVYPKLKIFNPEQLDLIVNHMNKNGLKQVNEKVLNDLEL